MPTARTYPPELRERAVRMVLEIRKDSGQQSGAISRVAKQLGMSRETLRLWVRRAEIDAQGLGKVPE